MPSRDQDGIVFYSDIGEETSPSEAVVAAVAVAENAEPTTIPPIYRAVDPDALDRLARESTVTTVTFLYTGYHVTVEGDEKVAVKTSEGPPD